MKTIQQKLVCIAIISLVVGLSACGGGAEDTAATGTTDTTGTTSAAMTGTGAATSTGTTGAATTNTGTDTADAGTTDADPMDTGTADTGTDPIGTGSPYTMASALAQNILPALTIDRNSSMGVAQLGLVGYRQAWVGNPNIEMELSRAKKEVEGGYSVKLKGGKIKNDWFYIDLLFAPSTSRFLGGRYKIGKYAVNEYKAFSSTDRSNVIQGFGITLQTLTESGFRSAGIGNWKYVDSYQMGVFSGRPNAVGSFTFGSSTTAAVVGKMPSTVYAGYAQSIGAPQSYIHDYSQHVWSTAVAVDKVKNTIKITIKTFPQYLFSSIYSDGLNMSMTSIPLNHVPQVSFTCTAPLAPARNSFECSMPKTGARYHGKIKGRFFGKSGEEMAGTFTIQMNGGIFYDETLVGAFLAKKN